MGKSIFAELWEQGKLLERGSAQVWADAEEHG